MTEENRKTVLGVTENLEALICYALGWVSGLVFLFLEKNNEYVRFHALQSLVTFGVLHVASTVLMFLPILGWLVAFCLRILSLVLWVLLMVKAYKGERYKLPVAGDFVEQQMAKK